jgi:hypothetical protein
MEQFVTYLRAELRKLGDEGDVGDFLAKSGCAEVASVPASLEGLMEAFASQPQVDEYVFGLGDADLVALTRCCGRWRNNNIANDLSPGQAVETIDVAMGQILLRPAEERLHSDFARLGWRLAAIAEDPYILEQPEYRDRTPSDIVDLRVCIAKPEPDEPGAFRVIDGIHRAIEMHRNGQESIRLCIVRDR